MLPIYWRTYTLIFGHARPQGLFELSLRRPSSQSRAQSSPAPRSAVGRRGELWGHGIFTAEIVRFRFFCACLGLM